MHKQYIELGELVKFLPLQYEVGHRVHYQKLLNFLAINGLYITYGVGLLYKDKGIILSGKGGVGKVTN